MIQGEEEHSLKHNLKQINKQQQKNTAIKQKRDGLGYYYEGFQFSKDGQEKTSRQIN